MSDTLRERAQQEVFALMEALPGGESRWDVAGRTVDLVLSVLHEAEKQEDERSEFLAKCPCCKGKRMPCDLCDGFRTVVIRSAGVLDHRVQGSRDRLFIPLDPSPAVAGEQDGCAHEWVYDSEGDYGECKLCDASINVVAGFSRTIHQPLPVRPPTGEQESDQ